MLLRACITQPWWSIHQLLIISYRFSVNLNFSSICKTKVLFKICPNFSPPSSPYQCRISASSDGTVFNYLKFLVNIATCRLLSQVLSHLDEECEDFLPWLERKAGVEISSKLYIGKSSYGRSLFASKTIHTGDCILRVPYSVQIASDNLLPKVSDLLDNKIESVTKLAMILLVEQKLCKESEWAPYLSCLPQLEDMHSTIFWSKSELDMIAPSSVYRETIKQKAQIEKDFLTIEPVLQHFSQNLRSITFQDFMHAYSLVKSRAWGSKKGASLIF